MIRSLIKLAFTALVAILCYNYFFGSDTEKEQSKRIFKGVGNVFTEVKDLVGSEREKYKKGKYDPAVDKMEDVMGKLNTYADANDDQNLRNQVSKMEARKRKLQAEMDALDAQQDQIQEYNQKPAKKKTNGQLRSKGANSEDEGDEFAEVQTQQQEQNKLQKSMKLAQDLKKFNDDLQKLVNQVTEEK